MINRILPTLLIVYTLLTLSACGSRNTKGSADIQKTEATAGSEVITAPESGAISIPIKDGYGKITVSKKERQNVYLSFDSGDGKQLYGKITSQDTLANVRFTQIVMPDGTMDGPFGNEIRYELPQKGKYEINIGENMMAGDPWSGVFTVEITLKK